MARDPGSAPADDDRPELTAYALGELEREETTVIELELPKDPKLRGELGELRTLTDLLVAELRGEPAPPLALRPDQRQAILSASRALPRPAAPPAVNAPEASAPARPAPAANPGRAPDLAETRLELALGERLEPVFILSAYLILGLLEPRLYRLGWRLATGLAQLRGVELEEPGDSLFGSQPGTVAVPYLRAVFIASFSALACSILLRTRRHRPLALWQHAVAVVLFLAIQYLLLARS